MVRKQRRLGCDKVREPAFQGASDAAMKLLPAAAQQGAVSGILHQRVLEGVLRVGRSAAAVDQLGADQLR